MLSAHRILLLLSVAALLQRGACHSTYDFLQDLKNRIFIFSNEPLPTQKLCPDCSQLDEVKNGSNILHNTTVYEKTFNRTDDENIGLQQINRVEANEKSDNELQNQINSTNTENINLLYKRVKSVANVSFSDIVANVSFSGTAANVSFSNTAANVTYLETDHQSIINVPYLNTDDQSIANVSYSNTEDQPTTNVPYSNIEDQPTTNVPYSNTEDQPTTNVPYSNIEDQPTTNVPYSNIEDQPMTNKSEIQKTYKSNYIQNDSTQDDQFINNKDPQDKIEGKGYQYTEHDQNKTNYRFNESSQTSNIGLSNQTKDFQKRQTLANKTYEGVNLHLGETITNIPFTLNTTVFTSKIENWTTSAVNNLNFENQDDLNNFKLTGKTTTEHNININFEQINSNYTNNCTTNINTLIIIENGTITKNYTNNEMLQENKPTNSDIKGDETESNLNKSNNGMGETTYSNISKQLGTEYTTVGVDLTSINSTDLNTINKSNLWNTTTSKQGFYINGLKYEAFDSEDTHRKTVKDFNSRKDQVKNTTISTLYSNSNEKKDNMSESNNTQNSSVTSKLNFEYINKTLNDSPRTTKAISNTKQNHNTTAITITEREKITEHEIIISNNTNSVVQINPTHLENLLLDSRQIVDKFFQNMTQILPILGPKIKITSSGNNTLWTSESMRDKDKFSQETKVNRAQNEMNETTTVNLNNESKHDTENNSTDKSYEETTTTVLLQNESDTLNIINTDIAKRTVEMNLADENLLLHTNRSIFFEDNRKQYFNCANDTTAESKVTQETTTSTNRKKRTIRLTIGTNENIEKGSSTTSKYENFESVTENIMLLNTSDPDTWNNTAQEADVTSYCYIQDEQCNNTMECCDNFVCVTPTEPNSTSYCDFSPSDSNSTTVMKFKKS